MLHLFPPEIAADILTHAYLPGQPNSGAGLSCLALVYKDWAASVKPQIMRVVTLGNKNSRSYRLFITQGPAQFRLVVVQLSCGPVGCATVLGKAQSGGVRGLRLMGSATFTIRPLLSMPALSGQFSCLIYLAPTLTSLTLRRPCSPRTWLFTKHT